MTRGEILGRLALVLLPVVLGVACRPSEPAGETSPEPSPSTRGSTQTAATPPDIVVIVVDDLRWDELGVTGHPFLETPNIDRLATEGALALNAFHAVPLCSPNRASILTGQYPSRHGILDNVARVRASHRLETFPMALRQAGYETGFLGKWHMGNDPSMRPGFDEWVAIPGQGRSVNPELFENGEVSTVEGYLTDILTDRAVDFVTRQRSRPFFLYLGHKAVHPDIQQSDDGSADLSASLGFVPAPRHRDRYADAPVSFRPNVVDSFDELNGKPALRRALERRLVNDIGESPGLDRDATRDDARRRAEMLLAVDESVGRIVEALASAGTLEQTVILVTSDNGYWYGEHGLTVERRLPYEEGIRAPLLVHFPLRVPAGLRIEQLVSSVDIAPTVLELAGLTVGDQIQGRSIVPLLEGSGANWRDAVLIEFYTYENPFPWLVDMDYRALRTERYKFIHWNQHPDEHELYDLAEDPHELRNVAAERPEVVAELRALLRREAVSALGLDDPRDPAPGQP